MTVQRILLLLFGAVVLGLFAWLIIFLLRTGGSLPPDEQLPDGSLPVWSGERPVFDDDDIVTVRSRSGTSFPFHDFLSDGDVEEWGDSNTYLIGSALAVTGEPLYQIFYYTFDQSIGVALLGEPLAVARAAAEESLQRRLGIGGGDLCHLMIRVSVPNFVDPSLAGRELGISTCPGAVTLPNRAPGV